MERAWCLHPTPRGLDYTRAQGVRTIVSRRIRTSSDAQMLYSYSPTNKDPTMQHALSYRARVAFFGTVRY
eukprot:1191848-Prorocentrum_minimum.AAC.1